MSSTSLYSTFYFRTPVRSSYVIRTFASRDFALKNDQLLKLAAKALDKDASTQEEAIDRELQEDIEERLNFANYEDEECQVPRNILTEFSDLSVYHIEGLTYSLEFYTGQTLPQVYLNSYFEMLSNNLKSLYESSGWKFDLDSKRSELLEESTRLIVALNPLDSNKLSAFAHFRFIQEDELAVLYLYELVVDQDARVRRKGLGTHLMKLLEAIGEEYEMDFIMLTVFNINLSAYRLYEKLGYKIDESSPDSSTDGATYKILSKQLL